MICSVAARAMVRAKRYVAVRLSIGTKHRQSDQ
jgi:hypothetical protein